MDAREAAEAARRALGLLTVEAVARLADAGVIVLDPFSALVSPGVSIEAGAILWPNVALIAEAGASIEIGAGVVLWQNVVVAAVEGGRVTVGPGAEIGVDGGFSIRADHCPVEIGPRARLAAGGRVSGVTVIGEGAQILGPIEARGCVLAGGGDHRHPAPDERGAVLKGSGRAEGLRLARGRVIQAFGLFRPEAETWQSAFHPPAAR